MNVDWLSAIQREGPDVPDWARTLISKSDETYCRREDTDSMTAHFQNLDCEVSLKLYEQARIALAAHSAVLQRQFELALHHDRPVEHCFRLFEMISGAGFGSPVAKSRLVVVLLIYLEARLTPLELKPLVDAMVNELEVCRVGCEENLSVLSTFLKAPPDGPA